MTDVWQHLIEKALELGATIVIDRSQNHAAIVSYDDVKYVGEPCNGFAWHALVWLEAEWLLKQRGAGA